MKGKVVFAVVVGLVFMLIQGGALAQDTPDDGGCLGNWTNGNVGQSEAVSGNPSMYITSDLEADKYGYSSLVALSPKREAVKWLRIWALKPKALW
jgi:hypothetical protein